jgi:molybdopterin-guanine dinucleotide biosynthesis protein A
MSQRMRRGDTRAVLSEQAKAQWQDESYKAYMTQRWREFYESHPEYRRATAERLKLPIRIIRKDLVPRCGPLGGIYTALKTSRKQAVLFLPCDMPFVSLALLEKLLSSLRPDDAGMFVVAHKRVSFPFLLHRNCLSGVEKQLAKKHYSLQALAAALRAKKIRRSPGEEMDLFNINTPQEWEIARQRCSAPERHAH